MNNNSWLEDLARWLGLMLIGLIGVALVTWLLYLVIGEISDAGRRWLCVILFYAVPVAFGVGVLIGRAYRSGFEASLTTRATPRADSAANVTLNQPPVERLPGAPRVYGADEAADLLKYLEALDA
jgi:apolipoprotein N-acyltransferase